MSDGKKALADKAIALGSAQAKRRYDASLPGPSFVEKIQHSILDALILKKVRGALGGEVKFCGNGGAAVSPSVREFIEAIGIPMTSGYGLTETNALGANNAGDTYLSKPTSTGFPVPKIIELKIIDEKQRQKVLRAIDKLDKPGFGIKGVEELLKKIF